MPKQNNDKIKLTCPNCSKTYHVRKNKIPAGSTAVRCKACAHLVPLEIQPATKCDVGDTAAPLAPIGNDVKKPGLSAPRCRLDLMTEEKRRRPSRKLLAIKPWSN